MCIGGGGVEEVKELVLLLRQRLCNYRFPHKFSVFL